jgi:SPP1 family predicted phage head-tail adaptor
MSPSLGTYRQLVSCEAPAGPPVPDGYGGYLTDWQPIDPAGWWCSVAPATARDLEDLAAGTVIAHATHIVKGPYHPGLTAQSRLVLEGRILNVVYVADKDLRHVETDLVCAEVIV